MGKAAEKERCDVVHPALNAGLVDRISGLIVGPFAAAAVPVRRGLPRDLSKNVIIVLGAQRSGTTWLGKIFDSHPNVLYRNEPDYTDPAAPGLTGEGLRTQVNHWIGQRNPRAAGKLPLSRKSWESLPVYIVRSAMCMVLAAGARLPKIGRFLARCNVPNFSRFPAKDARAVVKSISWCDGIRVLAGSLPDSRTILILRHPCGQIASVLRGVRERRFELRAGADLPLDVALTLNFAVAHGVGEAEFRALPDVAKYAWAWRVFNETAFRALAHQPNARIVLFEDLCDRPEAVVRELFAFADLTWSSSTQAFLARSTNRLRVSSYYSVLQDTRAVPGRWRTTMTLQDQAAIRAVVHHSPLAQLWPGDFDCAWVRNEVDPEEYSDDRRRGI